MVPAKPQILAVAALVLLAGCGGRPGAGGAEGSDPAAQEATYLNPPRVDTVRSGPGGLVLAGVAPAGGKVRLATPTGQALFAPVDARGRWTLALPPAEAPRIFGLSVAVGRRQAQAEGYVLVTPTGQAALLRAGAGALRIDPPARPGLRTVDFDRAGGMEVSAAAAPGATVILRLDGRQVGESRTGPDGRYHASLGSPTPIKPGAHEVQVFGDGFSDQATVQVSPAEPLAAGPLRSQLTPAGLRVDWMTPGGGVQSTVLVH